MSGEILCIVEGQSEVESLPILLRRLMEMKEFFDVAVSKPWRLKRQQFTRPGDVTRTWEILACKSDSPAMLVILFDQDDDPVESLVCTLRNALAPVCPIPTVIGVACREYECWLLAAKLSLRGRRGIRQDANIPEAPDRIRDGKGRLRNNMIPDCSYGEVTDQPAFTKLFDIKMAMEHSPSFARFCEDFWSALRQIKGQSAGHGAG